MELNIYSKDGSLKLTVSPSDSSTVTEEVGGECSVSVSFDTFELCAIEVNDYIEVDGIRYKARSTYRPKMKNRQSYSYSLRFYAPIHDAQQALMKTETDGGLISEFSLWGGPREHLQKWVDNMNRLAGSELWTIGSVITGENKNIDYRNVNCWDAAFGSNGIASTYETEMWADGYVINLCKCERGERVTLGYGAGLTSLTPEDNSDKVRFFTRLFPLGSTRNINVSTYGSSRLQLPSRATFVDHNTDRYGVFEDSEEDAFAGIFPQYIGTVTAVRSESKTDENGKKFTVYYIKDSGITWEPKALPEQTFMLSFQTGDLQGYGDDTNKSFQAEWHKDTKEWEIINIWLDENTQVPGGNIVPVVGNQYFPWNMIMPQEYITEAEKRYEATVNDFVANYSGEPVAYSGSTDYIHCAKEAVPLRIGQNVRLESDLYFEDGYQNTRITKVVRKLCRLTDATVTFAEQIGTGWKKSVDNQLSSLHYELQRQAEQASIDVIKTTDTKTPSDNNVFSALRSLATFLRKDKADSTNYLLTMLAGAVFGDNKAEINADGFLTAVKAILQNIVLSGDLKSDNFLAGALGSGYALLKKDADGKSYLEVDKLFARVKAIFAVLEIMKVTYTGGNFVFSPAGMQCTKVEEYESFYRCFFTADDGEKAVENTFEVDDLVQLREFNVKPGVYENVSNRYFWRRCIAKGGDYIDLSKADRDMTSNDAPMVGDSLVTIGNKTIKSRQNVIIISVYGEGSPSIIQYAGVNDYSLDGKAVTVISPSGNKFTGSFVIEATGKSVEDELSTAVEVANTAQKAAEKAQEDADTANSELGMIASDNYITPSEKTALKQQQADIQAERNEIIANATRYGVSTTAYSSAYTAANNALTKYTASSPQNIQVGTDYANISAYYAARKTILDAIAAAAKKLVTDLDNDLQGYKREVTQKFEAVDGRFTSVINETKTYTDNAVGNIQIGGRNLFRNTKNGGDWYVNNWSSGKYYVSKVPCEETVGGILLTEITRFYRSANTGGGDVKYLPESAAQNSRDELKGKSITISFFAKASADCEINISTCTLSNTPISDKSPTYFSITTSWIKKVVTVNINSELQGDGFQCFFRTGNIGVNIDIALFKVEIGNKATDWSPAPEDLTTRIEENSSKIEQLPGQITLEVDQKIKDIQVGGRNLFRNTKNGGDWYANNWSSGKYYVSKVSCEETVGGISLTEITRFYRSANTGGGDIKYNSNSAAHNSKDELAGKDITISFYARASANCVIYLGYSTLSSTNETFPNNFDITTEWQKKKLTVKLDSDLQGDGLLCFLRTNNIGVNIDIALFQVELGNKATDWTPAPEDLITKIEQNSSKIEQLPDQISLTVKKEITGGNYNYISGTSTPSVLEVAISGDSYFDHQYYIQKECKGKKILTAYKLKLEGCSFSSDAKMITQVEPRGGWPSWFESIIPNKALTTNGEFLLYGVYTAPSNITGQAKLNLRMRGVSGGTATISEMRCYEVEVDSVAESEILPWYPSKWDTEVLSSEIKQTAESISLKVNQAIGGENLIDNSSFSQNLSGWNINDESNTLASIVNSTALGGPCLLLSTRKTFAGIFRALSDQGKCYIEEGAVFTTSFDLYKKSSVPSSIRIGMEDKGLTDENILDLSDHPISTWKRVSVTQTMKSTSASFIIYAMSDQMSDVYIKNLKVERGSVATPWIESENERLLSTGIDILNRKMIFTANNTLIQDNSGKKIAMFTTTPEGKPLLAATNIDVDNLKVTHLDGADGTFTGMLESGSAEKKVVINPADGSIGFYYMGKKRIDILYGQKLGSTSAISVNMYDEQGKNTTWVNQYGFHSKIAEDDQYEIVSVSDSEGVSFLKYPKTGIGRAGMIAKLGITVNEENVQLSKLFIYGDIPTSSDFLTIGQVYQENGFLKVKKQ